MLWPLIYHWSGLPRWLSGRESTCRCRTEKAMAPHSGTLAWKIPRTEKPGGLQSMGSQRVGHDWETSLSLFTFMHWRRKWQPTPVLLPGKSHGRRIVVGYSPWGRKASDRTERLHFTLDANICPPPPQTEHFPSVGIISPKYLFEIF